jgi:hypothetical protein
MAAETLSALGYDELVAAWADEYSRRHEPLASPSPVARIDLAVPDDFASALGNMARIADWNAAFVEQLREHPWPEVVDHWARRLLVGYAGALTHGLLRVAHAVRALEGCRQPSVLLLDELARGLALWAATFQLLPGQPTLRGCHQLPQALAALPRPDVPSPMREAAVFSGLTELEQFEIAVESLGPPPPVTDPLSLLSASFCGEMLTHPDVSPVPLVHTVTPVAAARTLLAYMPDITAEDVYGLLWKVGAAVTVTFTPQKTAGLIDLDAPSSRELVARAVEHRDPHALKFTDACVGEYALNPDPRYLHAADHVLRNVPGWSPTAAHRLVS